MEKQQIEQFMSVNGAFFAPEDKNAVREYLAKADDAKANAIMSASFKNPTTIFIIAILLGTYGVDRFMLNDMGKGIIKFLTCGGCWIWWIMDILNAKKRTYEYNMTKLMSL